MTQAEKENNDILNQLSGETDVKFENQDSDVNIQAMLREKEFEEEFQKSIQLEQVKEFINTGRFYQHAQGMKLKTEELASQLGDNKDALDLESNKLFLKELPDDLKEFKSDFQELIDSNSLSDEDLKQAKKIVSTLDKIQDNFKKDDFTKNKILFGDLDKITSNLIEKNDVAPEGNELLGKIQNKKSRAEKDREDIEKEEAKRKKREKILQYVNTEIDTDNNALLKWSTDLLKARNKLTEEELRARIRNVNFKRLKAEDMLKNITFSRNIFGKTDVKSLFQQQLATHKRIKEEANAFGKLKNHFAELGELTMIGIKRESEFNPFYAPIGTAIKVKNALIPDVETSKFKFARRRTELGSKLLGSAGMIAGTSAIYAQIGKQRVHKYVLDKTDDVINKTVNYSDVVKDSLTNLGQESMLNIKSMISDARNGVTSPIIKEALEKAVDKKKELGDRMQNFFQNAKDSITPETPATEISKRRTPTF